MKLKRILALLLAAVMVFALAACGSEPEAAPAEEKPAEDSGKETVEAAEPAAEELTVWCWDPAFNIYAMQEAEKLYQKDHPNFKLNIIETPWPDVQTKVIAAATSDNTSDLPDILLMQDNAFQKNAISFPGLFLDLENSGINFDDFAKGKTAYSVVDGKHYGVPFDNGAAIAAYRTDVLEEAGFTVEDFTDITWDEYIEKGKVVLEKTGHPLLSCLAGEVDVVMMMIQSAGESLFDAEGNPAMEGNAVIEEVINTYVEMKNAGVLTEVNDWDQYVGSMTSGKVAGTINGCWILGSIQSAQDQSGSWAVTNMPRLVDAPNATNYSNNGGSSWALTANCQNTELAYDFLKSTFGSSVEFYETILPSSGALSTYIPAGDSSVYGEPQEFFAGQAIYKDITDYASRVPTNNTGVYYYEGRDAMATAVQNVIAGKDVAEELKNAQDTVNFAMGQ
ncbi:MAG: ABC transporter substrate-binding protein [Candidatus Limivicinus sp.]|jgi:lactose/L-arabinose transport system substrate-binding protein